MLETRFICLHIRTVHKNDIVRLPLVGTPSGLQFRRKVLRRKDSGAGPVVKGTFLKADVSADVWRFPHEPPAPLPNGGDVGDAWDRGDGVVP